MTDLELQHALAKMLPEKIDYLHNFAAKGTEIYWLETLQRIQDTEWLHVAWLIEQGLTPEQKTKYYWTLAAFLLGKEVPLNCTFVLINASWQQRAKALIATLGEKKGEK